MKLGVVHIEAVHYVLAVAHFSDLLEVVLVVVDTLIVPTAKRCQVDDSI